MLAPALWRDGSNGAFQDLQQCLLHALAGDVAGDRRVVALAGNLVDLIDIDDAALRALHIEVRGLQELQQDVFHVFADVAGFGERGGIGNSERHVQHPRQSLGQVGLTGTGRPKHQDVGLGDLHLVLVLRAAASWAGRARRCLLLGADALVVVVHRHRQDALGLILANDVLVQEGRNLARAWQLIGRLLLLRVLGRAQLFLDDFVAQLNTLVADVDTAASDELLHLLLALATKRTLEQISAFLHACH